MIKDIKLCLSCPDLEACKERLKKNKDRTRIMKINDKQLTYCSNMEK